jgi:hypothetical protein
MAGLYLEEFTIGQKFVHPVRRTVLDMDNMLFSALTYNPAAVHIDYEYAAGTEFGRPIVNSLFALGLVIGLSIHDTTHRYPPFEIAAWPGHRHAGARRYQSTRRGGLQDQARGADAEEAGLSRRFFVVRKAGEADD